MSWYIIIKLKIILTNLIYNNLTVLQAKILKLMQNNSSVLSNEYLLPALVTNNSLIFKIIVHILFQSMTNNIPIYTNMYIFMKN